MAKRAKEKDPYNDAEWLTELSGVAEAAFKLQTRGSVVHPSCLCDGCVLIQRRDWDLFRKATGKLAGWRGNVG